MNFALQFLLANWKVMAGGLVAAFLYFKVSGFISGAFEDWKTKEATITAISLERQEAEIERARAQARLEYIEKERADIERRYQEALARNAEARAGGSGQKDIFEKHDFARLVEAKPGLLEKAINRATNDRFKELERNFNR